MITIRTGFELLFNFTWFPQGNRRVKIMASSDGETSCSQEKVPSKRLILQLKALWIHWNIFLNITIGVQLTNELILFSLQILLEPYDYIMQIPGKMVRTQLATVSYIFTRYILIQRLCSIECICPIVSVSGFVVVRTLLIWNIASIHLYMYFRFFFVSGVRLLATDSRRKTEDYFRNYTDASQC